MGRAAHSTLPGPPPAARGAGPGAGRLRLACSIVSRRFAGLTALVLRDAVAPPACRRENEDLAGEQLVAPEAAPSLDPLHRCRGIRVVAGGDPPEGVAGPHEIPLVARLARPDRKSVV